MAGGDDRAHRADPPAGGAPTKRRWSGMRIYSSACDAARARRPTDVLLLVGAALALPATTLAAPGPTNLDTAITDFLGSLPGLGGWLWGLLFTMLTVWQLTLLVLAALNPRRRRLLGDYLLAMALALGLSLAASALAGTTWSEGIRALLQPGPPAVFPAIRIALFTSVIVTASPHLSRPMRNIGRGLLALGCAAGIVLGVALPIGMLSGFLVGVAAAAITHLVLGSPGGRPTRQAVAAGLMELGLGQLDVTEAPQQISGVAVFTARPALGASPPSVTAGLELPERDLEVRAYGADAWEGQLLTSTWSALWRRGQTPDLGASRLTRAEHEALATLLAERGDVPVLPIVAVGATLDGDVLLVTTAPAGFPLGAQPANTAGSGPQSPTPPTAPSATTPPSDTTSSPTPSAPTPPVPTPPSTETSADNTFSKTTSSAPASSSGDHSDTAVAAAAWEALGRLHSCGMAHGDIKATTVVSDGQGRIVLTGFAAATICAQPRDMAMDDARMLVTIATVLGPERAIEVARAGGVEEAKARLTPALPFLQQAILDPLTRSVVRASAWKLSDLLALAAEAVDVAPPEPERLARVTWSSAAKVLLIGLFGYWLVGTIAEVDWSSVAEAFRNADPAWVFGALVLSPLIQVFLAFATLGASTAPLRYGPVLALQYAIQFIALVLPASAARVALEVRFFQRFGIAPTAAVSIGVIDSLSGFVLQVILLVVIGINSIPAISPPPSQATPSPSPTQATDPSSFDPSTLLLVVAMAVIGLLVLVVLPRLRAALGAAVPRIRFALADQVSQARGALGVLRSPMRIGQMLGGNLLAQLLQALILGMCLRAFGQEVDFAGLILVNTAVSLFAGLMPVPGGMGVAEAGYTAGLQALGVPSAIAISTAMLFRMVTFYLPPIWGAPAMRWLRNRSYV